jgi:phosphoribosylformylglycinamidine cyclo-ligase
MYAPGHYDLAGFSVGIVERSEIINGATIQPGDVLIGLHSNGLHSNGFSLVRKVLFQDNEFELNTDPGSLGCSLGDELMKPTRIYVKDLLSLKKEVTIRGLAHITGGGLQENIPRVLPKGMGVEIDETTWTIPPIFRLLKEAGGLDDLDLKRTFNLGIGMVVIVPPEHAEKAARLCSSPIIGRVTAEAGVNWI